MAKYLILIYENESSYRDATPDAGSYVTGTSINVDGGRSPVV